MDKSLQSHHSIVINANTKSVWEVLTNPSHIAKYLFGTKTVTDWKMGSPIEFKGHYEGQDYADKGIVMAIAPYSLLAYDYWSQFSGLEDIPENYSEVSYHLKELESGQTEFTWTQIGFKDENSKAHHSSIMPSLLKKIKEIAEK